MIRSVVLQWLDRRLSALVTGEEILQVKRKKVLTSGDGGFERFVSPTGELLRAGKGDL